MNTQLRSGPQDVKILVVDDQWTIRMLNKRLLENSGYNVTAASSGKEALQCLNDDHYNLMLLDILMTDMNGTDVLKVVRERHTKQELPVIMVTAKRKDNDIVKALELGANDYLVKPVNLEAMIDCIRTYLPAPGMEGAT